MRFTRVKCSLFAVCLISLSAFYSAKAQTTVSKQTFDYYELKGLLLKHRATIESILGMKRFVLTSAKEREESTIYAYKKENDTTQILVRIRKKDGLANEVAWNESSFTLAYLTHDAVHDGFVPVNGNSMYQNRFQNMRLLVGYTYAENKTVPCIIRSVE